MRTALQRLVLTVGLGGLACSQPPPALDAGEVRCSGSEAPRSNKTVFGGTRPVTLEVPPQYDPACRTPLIILLHGYGGDGRLEELYLGLDRLVSARGVLLAAPTGTLDLDGKTFWNATDGCCNFYSSSVDDVGYLRGLISEISADYNVDRRRVFVIGHSNGGFMAYRLACEAAPEIAAVVSIAGATWDAPDRCAPSTPVSILEIHGNQDLDVLYPGGSNQAPRGTSPPYPGAEQTVKTWASYDGCEATRVAAGTADLDSSLPGPESVVSRHEACPAGVDVELWTIDGGSHIPTFSTSFPGSLWRWLAAHPRP